MGRKTAVFEGRRKIELLCGPLMRPNGSRRRLIDNLVTLCLNEIDADRLALRRTIEASLGRLEKETLINRNGDLYFFLTNEERDISREIKSVDIGSAEEAKLLGDIIFSDIIKGPPRHRYTPNKMDFSCTRLCDMHPIGAVDGQLLISVVSPLADEYALYADSRCIAESAADDGKVVIRLHDDDRLGRELRTHAQTDKYLKTKNDATLPLQRLRQPPRPHHRRLCP